MTTLTKSEAEAIIARAERGEIPWSKVAELNKALKSRLNAELIPTIWDGDQFRELHAGQIEAWTSAARIVAIFAGWQSGKTSIGPWWLRREVQRRGSGLYAVVSPHSPLLVSAALPLLKGVFCEPHWTYSGANGGSFTMTAQGELYYFGERQQTQTQIITRHAQDPKAIESWTAKGIWVDEPGQMDDSIWTALQARAMKHQARMLLTSRPYEHNWYVRDIWQRCMECTGNPDVDPWIRKSNAPADMECINFSTKANPSEGNQLEYERHSITGSAPMVPWAFRMMYDGIPTRPAGLVYTSFQTVATKDRPSNVVKFRDFFPDGMLPDEWTVWVGVDFGKRYTSFVLIAEEMEWDDEWIPMDNPRYCVFKAYQSEYQRTARDHMREAFRGMGGEGTYYDEQGNQREGFVLKRDQIIAYGGALGESGWRESYALCGLPILEPVITGSASVDPQIQAVWSAFQMGRLLVCEHLTEVISDLGVFSMEIDPETNEVTEKLKDEAKFHRLAALRYVVGAFLRSELLNKPGDMESPQFTM